MHTLPHSRYAAPPVVKIIVLMTTNALFSQELQADLMRQERIRSRVAMLESADAVVNLSKTIDAPAVTPMGSSVTARQPVNEWRDSEALPYAQKTPAPTPSTQDTLLPDQPEPWTPVARRRTG